MANQNLPELLTRRYGSQAPDERADALLTPTIRSLLGHRSVRRYRPDPLPPGALELLIAAAQSASTSSNLQTFSIIASTDPAHKAEISRLCGKQKHIDDCPLFLIFCADLARLEYVCQTAGTPDLGLDYMEMLIMAIVDASLAAQNLAAAAESLGLGVCYIGGARNHPDEMSELLRLPARAFAVFGLTVGVPATGEESVKARLPQLPGILHREVYDTAFEAPVTAYEAALLAFNDSQEGRHGRGWRDGSAARVASPEALGADRPRIKEILSRRRLGVL
jgi:nitroreductase